MKFVKMIIFLCFICIAVLVTSICPALNTENLKGLIIDGEGFWFIITEPDGWTVEIENANARKLNAYFVLDGHTWDNSSGVIYIRVLDKEGLTVEQHLEIDMKNFKKKKQTIQFKQFDINDIPYHHASKTYLIDNKYCDYLCYVDPGPEYMTYLIFVLSADMKVCDEYTATFRTFLKSFLWGGDQVIGVK